MAAPKMEPRHHRRAVPIAEHASRRAEGFDESDPRPKRTWPYALALLCAWGAIAGAVLVAHWVSEFPDVRGLLHSAPSRDITLLDAHGRLIARRGLVQSSIVPLKDLPRYVPDAFIAIEDRRFRDHIGLDVIGVARAALENMAAGHVVQGGSTITQQLVKNLFLESHRTLNRKAHEALLALYLESRYSKDEILTLYLNRVYFGAGVYGIEAASQRFFGKSAVALTLPEAAMLAGIVKAPAKFNPLADPKAARELCERLGSADKTLRFYEGMRHETLRETGREAVINELIAWLGTHAA